ncbi:MAG: HAD family hydrolase [Candidatus Zixiibacteriota bacterium]|nr:MAG: HAD family hydrolase [candidate division Zixibacteria bacterium]
MPSKAAFLDRDGTIIEEKDFIRTPDEIEFVPGSIDAIKMLRSLGYRIVVISNQSGIGRGILTDKMVADVNESFVRRLKDQGAPPDALYFCPHHPDDNCDCRKPRTGMIQRAVRELGLDLKDAVVVGDKLADVKLGRNIGATTVLVLTGYGRKVLDKLTDIDPDEKPDFVAENLFGAVGWLRDSGNPEP